MCIFLQANKNKQFMFSVEYSNFAQGMRQHISGAVVDFLPAFSGYIAT